MKRSFETSKQRGGVVLVALLTLSFGAVGALVWVNLIATRALHMDTAEDSLKRRIVLGNSRLVAKHYLYHNVVTEAFSANPDDIAFSVVDTDDEVWANFFVRGMTERVTGGANPEYEPTDRPQSVISKVGHQNRFSDAHNADSFGYAPEVILGDGTGLITGVDDSDPTTFDAPFRFFVKSRSPLIGGTGLYTALTEPGGALPTIASGGGAVASIARSYHAEPGSSGSYAYSSNYGQRSYRSDEPVPTHASPEISNFPDIVHTWGRPGGSGTVESDYNGRAFTAASAPSRLKDALRKRVSAVGQFSYLFVFAGVGDPNDLADAVGPGTEVLRYEVRNADESVVRSGELPFHYYNDGTMDGAKTEDPDHALAGADRFPHYHRPEDADPINGVSQVFRLDGAEIINTLRIDLTGSNLLPVVVGSGVEQLEFMGDGQYNGISKQTYSSVGAAAVIVAQTDPQAIEQVRFYGSRCSRALYVSIDNHGTDPINWLWHGAQPHAAGISSDPLVAISEPAFRMVAEVEGTPLDFNFNGAQADVLILGGLRISHPFTAGTSSQRVVFKEELMNPFSSVNANANTLGLVERYAARVSWIETYITLGLEK